MSWINVEQKLIGKKLRNFQKTLGCSQNEAIGLLIRFWLWGIDNAEMDGLLTGADESDIIDVLAVGMSGELSPAQVVTVMIECGWIDRKGNNLYIHDWEEWRKYYNDYMRKKQANAERQRRFYHSHKGKVEQGAEPAEKCADSPVQGGKADEGINKRVKEYPANFAEFWESYPRHDDKGEAYRKYQARLKDGWKPEELLAAATAYRDECRARHTAKEYIKRGKTFLSETTPFEDYLPKGEPQEENRYTPDGVNPFA